METLEQSVEASFFSGTSELQDNISSRLQEHTLNRIENQEHELLESLKHGAMKHSTESYYRQSWRYLFLDLPYSRQQ